MPRSSLVLAVLALAACQDYAFREVAPGRTTETSRFFKPQRKPADILFVVDDSGSMADEQENLARNFKKFIEGLAGAGDYRIAIVTTDMDGDNTEQEGTRTYGFHASPNRALNQSATQGTCAAIRPPIAHGCFRGPEGKRIISAGQPIQEQVDQFVTNVRVGACGSGLEQGLNAMVAALENTAAGRCNQGFLRPEANLVVVIVSDEEDCDGCNPRPPLEGYVARLAAIKGGAIDKVRVAVVAGAADRGGSWESAACRVGADGNADATCGARFCATRPPEGSHTTCAGNRNACGAAEFCDNRGTAQDASDDRCENADLLYWDGASASPHFCAWCSYYDTPDCCSALAGDRYVRFAKLVEDAVARSDGSVTGTGCRSVQGKRVACLVDSICQREFERTLSRIARDLIVSLEYPIDPPATYPAGVVVKVDGKVLTYGVDFDVLGNGTRVKIFGPNAPTGDEVVEITNATSD